MLGFVPGIPPQMLALLSGVAVAFSTAVFIIVLSFMAGYAFSMQSLKGFAKIELYELGVSAVILILSVLLIIPGGPFDMVSMGFLSPEVPGGTACREWLVLHGPYNPLSGNYEKGNIAFAQADYFIGCRLDFIGMVSGGGVQGDGIILRKLVNAYVNLMMMEFIYGFFSTAGLHFTIVTPILLEIGIGTIPHIALTPIVEFNTTVTDLVGTAITAMMGKKMLLAFIEESAIEVFLVLGLFLRVFPFTRKTGSTVIALVFAAYFVFPISILISQQMWNAIEDPPGPPGCIHVNGACGDDSDCCSGHCVAGAGPFASQKRCSPPLTDFDHAKSFMDMCYGKDESEINQTLETQAAGQEAQLQAYFNNQGAAPPGTKPVNRFATSLDSAWNVVAGPIIKMALPIAGDVWAFANSEKVMTDIGRIVLLVLMFTVSELLFTITLMKDFARLIGGEPRIIGISKLV